MKLPNLEFKKAIHHYIATNFPLVPFIFGALGIIPFVEKVTTQSSFIAPASEQDNVVGYCGKFAKQLSRRPMRQRCWHSKYQLWIFG